MMEKKTEYGFLSDDDRSQGKARTSFSRPSGLQLYLIEKIAIFCIRGEKIDMMNKDNS
jgi:hypothetical protein